MNRPGRIRIRFAIVTAAAALACAVAMFIAGRGGGEALKPLQVPYAGSMGSIMDGGVRTAIAKALGAELQGRASGSTGLTNLILARSIRPDVFISVTPGPMRSVLKAGKAQTAIPIARTEMVIAYIRRIIMRRRWRRPAARALRRGGKSCKRRGFASAAPIPTPTRRA